MYQSVVDFVVVRFIFSSLPPPPSTTNLAMMMTISNSSLALLLEKETVSSFSCYFLVSVLPSKAVLAGEMVVVR